jgi:hypothetical protein
MENRSECIFWIKLAHEGVKLLNVMNALMRFLVPKRIMEFTEHLSTRKAGLFWWNR